MSKHDRAIEAAIQAGDAVWRSKRTASKADAWAEGIAAYLAVMSEPDEGEVRVRVCVAVNATGGAMWAGGNGLDDAGNRDCTASTGLGLPLQYRWIEANVPAWAPPADPVVEGEVTE